MLTNPNTLGLFEEDIAEIAAAVHEVGGLLYYDGANLNAILGVVRPGRHGVRHRPHEPAQDLRRAPRRRRTRRRPGGGVGATGAVPARPDARRGRRRRVPTGRTPAQSIGRVHGWHGNALALARAYAYILANGGDGLRRVAEAAVLNANWLRHRLRGVYDIPYDRPNMHEFVASTADLKKATGLRALDVAKRLLEEGFHAPTVYFPLIVDEALMIEPTETESPQTLEALAEPSNASQDEQASDVHDRAAHDAGEPRRRGTRRPRTLIPTWDARAD